MPKAVCPKCGAEGECSHEAGVLHDGIFYDEYSFKCSKCVFGKVYEGGEMRDDPDTIVRFTIDHPASQCPYCGQFGSEKAKERFHAKVKQGLEALAADPNIGKEIGELLFAKVLEDFDNLSPAEQQIVISELKKKRLIS